MKKLIFSLFLLYSAMAYSQGTIPIPQVTGLPAALNSKVEKVTGKSLVADTSIVKLTGVQAGAQVNKIEGIQKNGVDLTITGKKVNITVPATAAEIGAEPANSNIQAHISNTLNPHSVTKTQVGLGSVDNTSDANKPISTATQTALNGKQASGTYSTDIHGNITALNAVSNINTGDETTATIKTKLGITTLSGANTGDQTTVSGNAGTATKLQIARTINGVAFDGTQNITVNAVDATSRVATSLLGAANGVATLDANGTILTTQLPSYIDDVLEYANLAAFPGMGETGKIYVAKDTNKTYRWSGSVYVYITSGAVDSVNGLTGVVSLSKSDLGLGNLDNTSDDNKPISTATQSALNGKQASGTYSTDIHGNITALNAVSGINGGDETLTSIKTKLGAASSSNSGYLTNTDFSNFSGKQPAGTYATGTGTATGTNTGDNAVNSLYSGLVSNATHTGDVTGSSVLTLATVNSNVGTYNNITIDAKGRAIAGSNVSYQPMITGLNTSSIAKWGGSSFANSMLSDDGVNFKIYPMTSGMPAIQICESPTGAYGYNLYVIGLGNASLPPNAFNIASIVSGTTTATSNPINFITGNSSGRTVKMSILPSGNVSIGSTTDDAVNKLQITGSVKSSSTITASGYKIPGKTSADYVLGDGSTTTVSGAVYKGQINGSTGSSLADGTGTAGWYYACSTAGTHNYGSGSITLAIGDQIYYNGTIWLKIPGAGSYTLPFASSSVLGGVIQGSGTSIDAGGAISIPNDHVAASIGTANGLALSGQAISLELASTSTTGAVSSTDWNNFNGKQSALGFTPYNSTNPSNYIPLTALSSSATGLTYTNTTGVFSLASGYSIPSTTSQTNWSTAYSWGNHAGLYKPIDYVPSYIESDVPTEQILDLNLLQSAAKLKYVRIAASSQNIFPTSNNANAVITLDMHTGESIYKQQLGFSSNGNLYQRINNNLWNTVWTSGNFIPNDYSLTTHIHGNITNSGLIGSTASLPLITGTGGIIQVGAFGTTSGTFCQGNDSRLSDSRTANGGTSVSFSGSLSGDVTGTQGATVVGKINGTSMAALATGILKNTTTTGKPSIAIAGTDYVIPSGNVATATNVAYSGLTGTVPTWNQNTTGSSATLTTARTIWGQSFNGSGNVSGAITGATTGTFSGKVTVTDVTDATIDPSINGSIITSGGIAAAKKIQAGGEIFSKGDIVADGDMYAGGSVQAASFSTYSGTSSQLMVADGSVVDVSSIGGGVNQTQTTVNASVSGNMVCSMPFQTGSYKKVMIMLNSMNGDATYTFPVPFTRATHGQFSQTISGLGFSYTNTTSSITITSASNANNTGCIILEGY